MIYMHSKYDNMHRNRIFNVFICINNHVNSCINWMLSEFLVCAFFMIERERESRVESRENKEDIENFSLPLSCLIEVDLTCEVLKA